MSNEQYHLHFHYRVCNEAELQVTSAGRMHTDRHTNTARIKDDEDPWAEPAKCSPVIRWWCSGFCSLWLIISSFQDARKQAINFFQVLVRFLSDATRERSAEVGLGLDWWEVKGAEQGRRCSGSLKGHGGNLLIHLLLCFLSLPLNLQSAQETSVMRGEETHPVKWERSQKLS